MRVWLGVEMDGWVDQLSPAESGDVITTDGIIAISLALCLGWRSWSERQDCFENPIQSRNYNSAISYLKGYFKGGR